MSSCCTLDTRRYFLLGMRWFFGIWLLYGGLMKWFLFGPTAFAGMIAKQFDPTWSPHALNVVLAYVILLAEPLLSLFLLSGLRQRLAWSLLALLMFMLTMGQTISMQTTVNLNWQFLVLTLVCAALSDPGGSCCSPTPRPSAEA